MYLKEDLNNTIIIEKSRFITFLKHVRNEAEYREYLAFIRKQYHDASHVCSALICGNIRRSSDDGEPSGTAGAPILNVLDKNGLDETCALVVRYFGGIKLGAGGLIRAYSNSVAEALKKAVFVKDVCYPAYELRLSYEMANRIDRFLRTETIFEDVSYDQDVCYRFALADADKLERIAEFTKGIAPLPIGEKIVQKVVK